MVSEAEFKQALKVIDRNTRLCLLYISEHIDQKLQTYSTLQTSHHTLIDTKISQLEKQVGTWQSTVKNLEMFEVRMTALLKVGDEVEKSVNTAKELLNEFRGLTEPELLSFIDVVTKKAVVPVIEEYFSRAKNEIEEMLNRAKEDNAKEMKKIERLVR